MAGPRNPPPPNNAGAGDNFNLKKEDLAKIDQLTREIQALEADRSSVNEDISSKRAAIKAFGIDMDAWRAAKRRKEMDPDDRQNFDRSQAMCNAALGVPVQGDLFAPAQESGSLPSGLH